MNMKKAAASLLAFCTLLLTSCLETTQEITIKEDGSGLLVNTTDMSAVISMAKQMGGAEDMANQPAMDSTIYMDKKADSMQGLSDLEKELLRHSNMRINMNMLDEKFLTVFTVPFSKAEDFNICNGLSGKVIQDAMAAQGGGLPVGEDGAVPAMSSFDDYFTTSFSNGLLVRTLNKEKYGKVADDEFLKGVQQMSAMGLAMKSTYIINLPRPVKNSEGKGLLISEDKLKVTISVDIDDLMEEPDKFEFRIEY